MRTFCALLGLGATAAATVEKAMSNPTQSEKPVMSKPARVAIKTINIEASFEKVFGFLANPLNWPRYAVVNLKSVEPGKDGWFVTETRFGSGELKINAVREHGIFDHVWRDAQATWNVPARVVRNNHGSTVEILIFQPPTMSDFQFDTAMAEMEIELRKLKEILESEN